MADTNVDQISKGCTAGCGLILFGFIAFVVVSCILKGPEPPPPDDQMASFMCGEFIKKQLRDPDSADFVTKPIDGRAVKAPNGSYVSLLTVRANNGFGGKTVSTFDCEVTKDSGGNWQLQSLSEVGTP